MYEHEIATTEPSTALPPGIVNSETKPETAVPTAETTKPRGRPLKKTPKMDSHYRLMLSSTLREEIDTFCEKTRRSLADVFRQASAHALSCVREEIQIDFSEGNINDPLDQAYCLSMEESTQEEIKTFCIENNVSQAAFFRVAVRQFVKNDGKGKTKRQS